MSDPMPEKLDAGLDTVVFNEAQLLLAEKRTALSTLRTGISIFAFPLSVLSVLIATSRSYEIGEVLHWLLPLLLINLGLVGLAVYLVAVAIRRIHHYDQLIAGLKRKHNALVALMD